MTGTQQPDVQMTDAEYALQLQKEQEASILPYQYVIRNRSIIAVQRKEW